MAIRAYTFLIIDRVLQLIPGFLGLERGVQGRHRVIYYLLVFEDVGQLGRGLLSSDYQFRGVPWGDTLKGCT